MTASTAPAVTGSARYGADLDSGRRGRIITFFGNQACDCSDHKPGAAQGLPESGMMPRRHKPLRNATPEYDVEESARDAVSPVLDRALMARAARYIARHLDWFDLSEAGDPAGYELARQLAQAAGIEEEIENRLTQRRS